MGEYIDKGRNALQENKGKVQETAGRVTDDRSLEAKGMGNQAAGKAKGFGERVKDLFRR